jgi:hypothetical protein
MIYQRTKRNPYATIRNPVIKKSKDDSRKAIITAIINAGMKVEHCALLPSVGAVDVKEFRKLKPKGFVLIERDWDKHRHMVVPDSPKYKRFRGDAKFLFDSSSYSYQLFLKDYHTEPINNDVNLVWLDFCSQIHAFPTNRRTEWNPFLKRGGYLFVTHLLGSNSLTEIENEYRSTFKNIDIFLSHPYITTSKMIVIGLRYIQPIQSPNRISVQHPR